MTSKGAADQIKEMKEDFKDLDLAILDGAKQFRVLRDSISKTNSLLGSKNWIIFSRFISGTPLWRIQNRIKATVMFMNEISSRAEKQRTQEAKEIQNYAKIAKMQRKAEKIQKDLVKIEAATGEEREKLVEALKDSSELYEGLVMKLGTEEAGTKRLLELMDERVSQAEKLENKAKVAANLRDADFRTKMKHYSGLTSAQKVLNDFKTKTTEQINKSEMAAEKTKLTTLQKMRLKMGGVDPSRMTDKDGNVKKPTQELNTTSFATLFGKGRFRDAKSKFASEKQFKLMKKMHDINKRNDAIRKRFLYKPLKQMYEKVKDIALNMLKLVFYALAQFLKVLLILMVLVTAFKIIEPYLGNIWDALSAMATVFSNGIGMVVEGISAMFNGVYNILMGILDWDWEQFKKGIGQLFSGIMGVLLGVLVATLGTIWTGITTFVGSLFTDGFNELGGGIKGVIAGVGNVIKGVAGVVGAIAMVVGIIALLVGATFAAPALIVAGIALAIYIAMDYIVAGLMMIVDGISTVIQWVKDFDIKASIIDPLVVGISNAIGDILDAIPSPSDAVNSITSKIPFLATGGLVQQSGIAIVGEKGPELVTLPAGSRVHSNKDSANMVAGNTVNNHITVQVTGRVGASDIEIRDIANKVAREINTRINRTSTSVVKF